MLLRQSLKGSWVDGVGLGAAERSGVVTASLRSRLKGALIARRHLWQRHRVLAQANHGFDQQPHAEAEDAGGD